MKYMVIIFILLVPVSIQAQSKKQRKALAEQIIKLQVYIGYVKKGYNILDKGLTTIGDIKDGDWNLHRLFLDKRKNVSPKVKSYGRIAAIIATQTQLIRSHRTWQERMSLMPKTPAVRMEFYQQVSAQMLDRTITLLSELVLLVTDGQYQMTDPERIERLELIHALHRKEAQQLLTFCNQTFTTSTHHHQQAAQLHRLQQQY